MIELEQENPQIKESEDELTLKRIIARIQVTKRIRLTKRLMYNPSRPFNSFNLSIKNIPKTITIINTLSHVERYVDLWQRIMRRQPLPDILARESQD
jgi:hypothetical protein